MRAGMAALQRAWEAAEALPPTLAIVAIGAWQVLDLPGTSVDGIPVSPAWLLLVAACVLGFAGARVLGAQGRERGARDLVALVAGGLLAAGSVVALLTGADHPRAIGIAVLIVGTASMAGAGAAIGWWRPTLPIAGLILAAEVVSIWLVRDTAIWATGRHFYDLRVYFAAAVHARLGQPVYLPAPITALPQSAAQDFFLYPPPLIPVLRVASRIPIGIAGPLFAGLMAGCAVLAFRLLGTPWRWSLALLAFPPLMKGMESGNVANLTFLLFVAGIRFGPTLVVGGLFKVQNVIPAAWLIRERRWRDVAVGVGVLAAVGLATLPFVGVSAWTAWLQGLGYRAQSQVNLPILYGLSPARVLPPLVFLGLSVGAVALAFALRGRRGLAGLGLASIVASPSLWPHGFVMALPAALATTSSTMAWLVLGVGAIGSAGLWLMAALAALVVLVGRWDGGRIPDDPLHPLGGTRGPWTGRPGLEPTTAES